MNYGFAIDNRRCIGCHACSTACKSENDVPLGVSRTWVKYVEVGAFPDTRRHFQVNRCNHCANPPCARICPVGAMYQRDDGIVEFDAQKCIGCKACLQACPYDAIHIDPSTGTAAKCHFCAHRLEIDLEPACVVVCPTEAIWWGDLDDVESPISQLLAREKVSVRKPEQGTGPKLFYVNGSDATLHPTAHEAPQTYLWADVIDPHAGANLNNGAKNPVALSNGAARPKPSTSHRNNGHHRSPNGRVSRSGQPIRQPQGQSRPEGGPIQIGGRLAEQMVQVAYNAQHKTPWHWPVPAYLVTKGIASGLFMVLAVALGLGWASPDPATLVAAGLVILVFVGATTGLLVYDLEKPTRFLWIVLRPQLKSWLARGAFILIGFSSLAGLWWLIEAAAWAGLLSPDVAETARPALLWIGLPLAVGTAIYTAFLFAQAEGRDLWQSPLLPFHLLVQAAMMGCAAVLALNLLIAIPADLLVVATIGFGVALGTDLFVMLLGEFSIPHSSELAARAAHDITHGRYRRHFWWGSVALGHLVPLLTLLGAPWLVGLGALAAVVGLYFYEHAFVMAPQHVPNS